MKAQAEIPNQITRHSRQHPFFQKKEEGSFFASLGIQPKLTIGESDDRYEQEADGMAERVVQGKIQRKYNALKCEKQMAQPMIQRMSPRDYPEGFVDDEDQMYQSPVQLKTQNMR